MSLINQMLKDLDKRKKPTANPSMVYSGLRMSSLRGTRNKKMSWLFCGSVTAVIVLLLGLVIAIVHSHSARKHVGIPSLPIGVPQGVDMSITQINSIPALLTGVTLQSESGTTNLRFLLNQDALYRVSENVNTHTMTIILERTRLVTALPSINYLNTAIQGIVLKNQINGSLKIIISLKANVFIQHLDLIKIGQLPELQINLAESDPVLESLPQQIPAKVVKKPAIDMHALQQAEIQSVMQRARVFVDEGKLTQAIALLERGASPTLKEYPDYYALLAALYQRHAQYSMAIALYEHLIETNPDKSVWWLGLAIAMESSGDQVHAVDAYAHARQSGGLNPELSAYAAKQINDMRASG